MTRFARIRKTLGIALVACTLTPPALLVAQVASPHTALAGIDVYPVAVDGSWHTLGQERISQVIVTRQTHATKSGATFTRFIVQAFFGVQSIGTGATTWAILDPFHQGSFSVTITGPCTSIPVCPDLHTDLQMTTHHGGNIIPGPTATLQVLDHTLVGDVAWVEEPLVRS